MTALSPADGAACPCGSGTVYADCCGPLHRQERPARTATELMRSRYSAFVVGDPDHLFRTWHPRTRPHDVVVEPVGWLGLSIVAATGGGPDDDAGTVEFIARHEDGRLHERSRFARRAGRWRYLDGEISPAD